MKKNTKPFKGVITGWHREGDVIVGKCNFHIDALETISAMTLVNYLVMRGCKMHTSKIAKLQNFGLFALLETEDSFYVLVDQDVPLRRGG